MLNVLSCGGIPMLGTCCRSEAIPTLSRDFPSTYTLWHQQLFGRTASSPVPVPLENLGWGTVVCGKHLLLNGGVNPLLLGVRVTC